MFESIGVDIVLRLRELRRSLGLQQKDVALLTGIGEKSISSFETGARLDTMKIGQLRRLLQVYGVTEAEFFSDDFESLLGFDDAPASQDGPFAIWRQMRDLPEPVRNGLLEKFQLMVETATEVHSMTQPMPYESPRNDWELLNSRN
ncbi:MAG: helix-turn-helix transcriptional regulator [Thermoanaerobaculia bacterium]|jgi:transcriptional regulator with XRE-family HTH domain